MALHWLEEFEVWEALTDGRIDEATQTVEVELRDLSPVTTNTGSTRPGGDAEPDVVAQIVNMRVGTGYPLVLDRVTAGQTLIVEYIVRNAGKHPLSAVDKEASGQVILSSPVPVQELPELQSHVPLSLGNLLPFDHWKPGIAYNSASVSGNTDVVNSIHTILVPNIEAGRQTVRLELVFWDGDGNAISRNVVERVIDVTASPFIDSAIVEVALDDYRVESKIVDDNGTVEYSVRRHGGFVVEVVDTKLREKIIYTAAVQQEIRSTVENWAARGLYLGRQTTHWTFEGADEVLFLVDKVADVTTLLVAPNAGLRVRAAVNLTVGTVNEFLKKATGHPEVLTEEAAVRMSRKARSAFQNARRIYDDTRRGETLEFYDAITYHDSHRLYDIYWEPSASTFLSLAPFLQRFGEDDLAALGTDISRRAAGPVDDLVLDSGVLTSFLEVVEALSLMGELGAALEDFQPWNSLKAEIQGNINDQRRAHAEYLAKLGITDTAPFRLPVLMDLVVPHYTELDFTSSTVAPESQSEAEPGPAEVQEPPTAGEVTPVGSSLALPSSLDFSSVSAEGNHTCAVKADGTVACWGSDENGQATPPSGQFTSVSAGFAQTCGVKFDGTVVCWGEDRWGHGNLTPPAGRVYRSQRQFIPLLRGEDRQYSRLLG